MEKKVYGIVLILLLFLIQSCTWMEFESTQIVVQSDTIQLEWDPPEVKNFDEGFIILYYRVYYRIHEMENWVLLDIIPAQDHPKYKIHHSELGNGSYDFAVRAVSAKSSYSSLHSSLDLTADPLGGWYVVWFRF